MIMVLGPHKKKAEAMAERGRGPSAQPARSGRGRPPRTATEGSRRTELSHQPLDSSANDRQETTAAMPKNKTHSGAKKRFRVTGTGKLMREQANRRHLLEHKSSTRTRRMAGADVSVQGRRARRSRSCSASDRATRPDLYELQ